MPARFALCLFLLVAGVGSAAGQGPTATAGVDFPLQVPTQGPSCVLPPDGSGQRTHGRSLRHTRAVSGPAAFGPRSAEEGWGWVPACSRRSAFGALYVAEVSAGPRRNPATQVHKSVISGIVRPSHIPLWCRSLNEARFFLLQVRNLDDPIREHEVSCFSRALGTGNGQLQVFDLLSGAPSPAQLDAVDVVPIGGSGDYIRGARGRMASRGARGNGRTL